MRVTAPPRRVGDGRQSLAQLLHLLGERRRDEPEELARDAVHLGAHDANLAELQAYAHPRAPLRLTAHALLDGSELISASATCGPRCLQTDRRLDPPVALHARIAPPLQHPVILDERRQVLASVLPRQLPPVGKEELVALLRLADEQGLNSVAQRVLEGDALERCSDPDGRADLGELAASRHASRMRG